MQSIQCTPDLARRLAPLFDGDRPIPIRLWAVLDGLIPGRVVADDPAQPAWALVQELAEGTAYIGGAPAPEQLAGGLALLRASQAAVVCLWPDDRRWAMLPAAPSYQGTAIDFLDRAPDVDLGRLAALPAGYALRPIDAALAASLAGFDYYDAMFGGREAALAQTIGACVLHDGAVVAEAVAGPLVRGLAEIGVGTAEAHRRRGLAAAVAAHVIRAVEARGYRAFWNAAAHNTPSVALARRLGFRTERPFTVRVWERLA